MELEQLDNNDPKRLYCATRTTTAECRHTVGTIRPRLATSVSMLVPVNTHTEEMEAAVLFHHNLEMINLTKATLITHHTLLDRLEGR